MCVSAILLGFVYYRQCVHLMHKSYTFPLNSVSEGFFFFLPSVSIQCTELKGTFIGGVNCSSAEEIGAVTFTCSYDAAPAEDCKFLLLSVCMLCM